MAISDDGDQKKKKPLDSLWPSFAKKKNENQYWKQIGTQEIETFDRLEIIECVVIQLNMKR